MENLPKERIAAFKPAFTITRVGCFGPVTIKQNELTRASNIPRQRNMEFYLLVSQPGTYI